MLLVGGQFTSWRSICCTVPRPRLAKRAAISSLRPSACSTAAAMRQGSRAARSPPGSAKLAQVARRSIAGAVDAQQFAAPGAAVVAEADAVEREPEHRSVDAMLGQHRRDVRVVVLHGDERHAMRCGASRAA